MDNRNEFSDLYEHEKMLADKVRLSSYRRAIEKHISVGDTVLDLGTGTGILSYFAARKKPGKIYAIDHSDFIDVAVKIAQENKFENIQFVKTNSRNFKPKVMFDVIIHEQMGDYLFNENMIENILDLKKRVLKQNGKILPGKFELYLEPVDLHDEFNIPFIWENKISGVDFSFLEKFYETLEKFKPADYRQEWIDASAVKKFLCEPEPILVFDLENMNSESEIPRTIEKEKEFLVSGNFDGFCLYFNAIFDDEICLNTSPFSEYTHWGNCLFRIETRSCMKGKKLKFKLGLPDLLDIRTWRVSIQRFE